MKLTLITFLKKTPQQDFVYFKRVNFMAKQRFHADFFHTKIILLAVTSYRTI